MATAHRPEAARNGGRGAFGRIGGTAGGSPRPSRAILFTFWPDTSSSAASSGRRCWGRRTRSTATSRRCSRRSSPPAGCRLVQPGPPHPVDPPGLPRHLLLLPEGVLPLLLRRPAGMRRRRAEDPPQVRDGDAPPVHPPEHPSVLPVPGIDPAVLPVARRLRVARAPEWPTAGARQRGLLRERGAVDRLLAVVQLAAPHRGRPARLLLVHAPAASAVLAVAAADEAQPPSHGLGLGELPVRDAGRRVCPVARAGVVPGPRHPPL